MSLEGFTGNGFNFYVLILFEYRTQIYNIFGSQLIYLHAICNS